MPTDTPTLHMLCGKIAAGKSTLAARLGAAPHTVVLSEDAWLSALYSDRMSTGAEFMRYSARLRAAMGPHIVALLRAGLSVVLDFQSNRVEDRRWLRTLLDDTGARHTLHVLDVPDEVCLARLHARNAAGTHAFTVSDDLFRRFTANFEPPTPEEGFEIVVHRPADP